IILGMTKYELSFFDVLAGRASVKDVICKNYGIKVVPTGFRFEEAHDAISSLKRGSGTGPTRTTQ
ncbi:MAG: hypothetical protein ACP5R5_13675, partial [Armatimonadota bacterium]